MGWLQLLQEKSEKNAPAEGKGTILIIDDEVELANTLANFLSLENYVVYEANSGEEGLKIYLKRRPQIVITDLKMPGISGLELLEKIRSHDDSAEIIVLTAYGDSNSIIRALKSQASDFILKPVDLQTLKFTVEKAVERLKLKQQVKDYTNRLEELLQNVKYTKEYLQKIVENSPQAIIAYNLDGKISEWNSEAEKITGYSSKEVIGKLLHDIFVLEDVLIKPDQDNKKLQIKNVIGQILTKSGGLRFITRNANAILDEKQNIIGGIENFYDVTEQVKNDQLLEKRYLQLQTINEIGKKIASCNDLNEISQFVIDRLVKTFFESSQITIFYYDPQEDRLILTAMAGLNIQRVKKRYPIGTPFDKNQGIIGHVFNTGKSIIAEDVNEVPFYHKGSISETRSEFAFPIRFKDRVFGVLNIENIENITLDEADRFMIEAIAEYLGIGKERIELMDRITLQNIQLEKQAKELKQALKKVESQKKIIEDQNKRLITDLHKASEFQRSLLPEKLPDLPGLRFASLYVPSSQLGGDFYDVFEIDDRYVAIVMADASGHGVAAAMLSAMFKMTLHKYSPEILNPAVVLQKMNEDFCGVLQMGEFFSAFLAVYDRKEKWFRYANGGHPRPMLLDYSKNEVRELDTNGMLLGIISEGVEYEQKQLILNGEFRLIIYTDGINEAINAKEEQFGLKRIKELLLNNANKTPDVFIKNTQKILALYSGSRNFDDDVTIIVVDKLREPQHVESKQ
ncbi:MAG: SpoIIE family protein phosphatase [Calditrichaeota bacterium]|nr:SpoIIE family protein phosphatase [Calditrichota bacterium]